MGGLFVSLSLFRCLPFDFFTMTMMETQYLTASSSITQIVTPMAFPRLLRGGDAADAIVGLQLRLPLGLAARSFHLRRPRSFRPRRANAAAHRHDAYDNYFFERALGAPCARGLDVF